MGLLKSLFTRANIEKLVILLYSKINQMKAIVSSVTNRGFWKVLKNSKTKISLQGKTVCNSVSNSHVQLYLEVAAEQSSWRILSRGAGCDHSWVCMWPAAALPCTQRAPTYDTQRKAAEEHCLFGRAQQVLPALSPGEEQLMPAALSSSCSVTQTPLQQAGHFSLAPPQGRVASHKE